MIQLPKDMTTVVNEFFQFLAKKDHGALFKLFAPDGVLTDFESNGHRAAAIEGFVREWPRTLTIKTGRIQLAGQTALVQFTLTGGGFTKPTEARARMAANDKYQLTSVRLELA